MGLLVEARGLRFSYAGIRSKRRSEKWELDSLDFEIERGSTIGVVGESGSGKSTLIRVLCGLLPSYSGSCLYAGRELRDWVREVPRDFRSQNQMIFQSPASSFDPRMRIGASLAEPVKAIERRSPSIDELVRQLRDVGLNDEILSRYPHQLSGGQLQRVAIARALLVNPNVLYADEPTSALDVSVQAQVLNLLMDIRAELGLTLVMVSHDLAVVSRMCEYLLIMCKGEIVESGFTEDIVADPGSPYTKTLIEAANAVSLDSALANGKKQIPNEIVAQSA
ncbi:ABC-type glutathione transport system ATPase component [Amycolatopsis bartoniae]|uniref:ABC transporter ATP-binding protein n=1 Tax=Amycolatopsis bartoniae TaxID=941986 RepID=UPI001605C1B0|nr:dipeptide/oligopeptide/nickel ABC transporter ATP-binding protein [Amycolatopsis bartoniae]MBB2933551.1 ABC-type glutathione transport system ATPase component [Amycolatopsis bartoniae]